MRAKSALGLTLALAFSPSFSLKAQTRQGLDVYVIDVEGGEATLFVSPSGESMLVDTGWPGFQGRDADRIASAAKAAGIAQIDYLVITHFHADHMGGVQQLSERLPIRHFVDHGSSVQHEQNQQKDFAAYDAIRSKSAHQLAKPGDPIPIRGLDVRIIAAAGEVLSTPLPGADRSNPFCAGFKYQEGDVIQQEQGFRAEDPQSVSLFLTYGTFRTVIMGDLTWNKEFGLMCPNSKIGTVDVYLVSHHGSDTSGSEALVHFLHPRVAIMNNGPAKGGAVQTFKIVSASPGLIDLWQSHYSIPGGKDYNRPEQFIANLEPGRAVAQTSSTPSQAGAGAQQPNPPPHMGPANWIKLSARNDGSFTVTNSRNGLTKTYPASR